MPTLYNFSWVESYLSQLMPHVGLRQLATMNTQPLLRTVVLWPALLTPAVHLREKEDDNWIELLLATRTDELQPAYVNRRLKMTAGLSKTIFHKEPLFTKDIEKNIEVKSVSPDGNGILATKSQFKGILHKLALKGFLSDYKKFWAVRLNSKVLLDPDELGRRAAGGPGDYGPDAYDTAVTKLLLDRNGKSLPGGGGLVELAISGSGVDVTRSTSTAVSAHHPLVVFDAGTLGWANFAHASDIHLNARQLILSQSPARVIEGATGNDSAPIGLTMNVCSQAFSEVLGSVPNDVHALLIGGDLIDHMQNAWTKKPITSPIDVWKTVDLSNNYDDNYQSCVDLLSFYTMIADFYRGRQLPVFGVSGNHDCYQKAFGISPRVLGTKANEGIPADNNLTFYEALLVFGKTYGKNKSWGDPFTKDLYDWFYTVLSPWADYAVRMPKQRVVGMEWGDAEDIIEPFQGQGLGHLPRASSSVSSGQLQLFIGELSDARPTVLLTHFTVISYADKVPIKPASTTPEQRASNQLKPQGGTVSTTGSFGTYDLGTFEDSRVQMYTQISNHDNVQAVFTGHSHRKGLYFLNRRGFDGDNFPTSMFNFDDPIDAGRLPASVRDDTPIIVSDSGGPLPRFNLDGEFAAWGSDRPSGTAAYFPDGKLSKVVPLRTTAPRSQPRLVVALDYQQSMAGGIFDRFETAEFDPFQESQNDLALTIQLKGTVSKVVTLQSVVFYSKSSDDAKLTRCAAGPASRNGGTVWVVPASDLKTLRDWLNFGVLAGRFLSLTFAANDSWPLGNKYNCEDPWNICVDVRVNFDTGVQMPMMDPGAYMPATSAPTKSYTIVTGSSVETPDFAWRERLYKKMYP
jgi:hypothetical protein